MAIHMASRVQSNVCPGGAWAAKKPLHALAYFCNPPLSIPFPLLDLLLRSIIFLQRQLTAPPDFQLTPLCAPLRQ